MGIATKWKEKQKQINKERNGKKQDGKKQINLKKRGVTTK